MANRGTWSRQPRLRRRTSRPVWVGPGPPQDITLTPVGVDVNPFDFEIDAGATPATDVATRAIVTNVLGCGTWTFDLYDHVTGVAVIEALDEVAGSHLSRRLDAMSDATIVLGPTCTTLLTNPDGTPKVRTWRHYLRAARNGVLWFDGPITRVHYGRDTITIEANDVLAWMAKRVVRSFHDFTKDGDGPIDCALLARRVIAEALAPDDPGVSVVVTAGSGTPVEIKLEVGTPVLDVLGTLAATGVDITAIGRAIYVGPEILPAPTATLVEDDFLVDADVWEDGWQAATAAWYAGQAIAETAGGVDPYFGLIEAAVKDTQVSSANAAKAVVAAMVAYGQNPPFVVSMPSDAALAPDARISFDALVPGAVFRFTINRGIRFVTSMRLTSVVVDADSSNVEQVKITLAPVGSAT